MSSSRALLDGGARVGGGESFGRLDEIENLDRGLRMQLTNDTKPARRERLTPDSLADRLRMKAKRSRQFSAPDLLNDLDGICHVGDDHPQYVDLSRRHTWIAALVYKADNSRMKKSVSEIVGPKVVGARIRALREVYDLNQEDFGRKIGVGKTAVSNWEVGLRRPGPEDSFQIVSEFKVTFDFIFRGDVMRLEKWLADALSSKLDESIQG